ncbi:hypothetical protein [Pseudoflavonifractor phocaeensis]|uniref:hypothetical protein n=1 Tax=Pseudoflavonifractor phocaeensis TaxID=1870988 RepID=UPI001F1C8778|nr:hypothetical protein [Pseudoflavonifractor phocaeensis]MCF2660758.1 hypothetical protein [Pseudoflavonifractor phocaeensis]
MCEYSDIIKSFDKSDIIYERLADWGKGGKTSWISPLHSSAFVALYRGFYQHQKHFPLECYEQLAGWECGLYQVLDISREDICKVLPILLTAYSFHYARQCIPFIRRFLAQGIPNSWKSIGPLSPNSYYIGEYPDNDSQDIAMDTGIGKLLSGIGGASKKELKNYAAAFCFERLQTVFLTMPFSDTRVSVTSEYIIPVKGSSTFFRNVHKRKWITDSGKKIKEDVYTGERFEFHPDELLELGLSWMHVVYMTAKENIQSAASRQQKADFACEPDLYACYRYLWYVLNSENFPKTKYDHLNASERDFAIMRDLDKMFPIKKKLRR